MSTTGVVLVLLGVLVLVPVGLVLFTALTARRVQRALPPRGSFVDVDGARIHYIERGSGPVTLLMVHGLGGNAMNFTHSVLDLLAVDHHVVVMERPGSGYSTRAAGAAAGPLAQADTVARVIQALQLDRPVLVGHSLGGAVSLATAVAHPSLVRALALVAPLTMLTGEPPAAFRGLMLGNSLLRSAIGWTLATPLSMVKRDVMLAQIFGPEPVPADFALAGGGILGMRPAAFVAASTDMIAVPADMPQLMERYRALTMPVGVLYGTEDRILDPSVHGGAQLQALLPHVQLEYVQGAGHMLPLTNPERVAAFVRWVVSSTP